MLFSTAIFLGLAASVVAHPQKGGRFGCDAEPDEEMQAEAAAMAMQEDDEFYAGLPSFEEHLKVPVVVHIVAAGRTLDQGWVPQSQVKAQIEVMNAEYHSSGVTFQLVNTTRTVNKAWASGSNILEKKQALRQGDYGTLNLYLQKTLGAGLLGQCTFPLKTAEPSNNLYALDGCTVAYDTVPGGTDPDYNEGKTAVHEVGHWFNLFHVWTNACQEPGDWVRDTPAQATASYGCKPRKNTCPGVEGKDNVHNFMDYSDDYCLSEFTDGQTRRMHNSYRTFRDGK